MTRDHDSAPRQVYLAPSQTLDGYDRWADHYDRMDNPMVAATAWALAEVPLDVAGARVVELGCGTGRHAALALAAGAAAYTGVDGSPGMLAQARARTADLRATWRAGDVAATTLPAGGFDRALIVLVLEHVVDLAPVFAEVARLLAPGGRLRLLEIHPDLLAAGAHAHFHDGEVEVRFASVRHDVAAIEAALAAAGLTVTARREPTADGALLAAVPRLAKHRGRRAVLDLEATAPAPRGAARRR
ncbi:MAG TPA: class I SAM-dependent methyltransferase [Kofleriaceae bacterium]|nr:class I SAM-dependent methyltransferase [Kofleriaceae bacterium]